MDGKYDENKYGKIIMFLGIYYRGIHMNYALYVILCKKKKLYCKYKNFATQVEPPIMDTLRPL